MQLECKPFEAISAMQLYHLLQLRQRVFIQEQASIYDDIDGLDINSFHVLAVEQGELLGYLRFRKAGDTSKFERVVLKRQARGSGLGRTLFQYALEQEKALIAANTLALSAQVEIVAFYESFGFTVQGEPYDDGGVMHVDMVSVSQ